MAFSSRIRGLFWLSVILILIAAFSAQLHAQKRISAKVEPNANSINSSADVYNPTTSTLASTGTMSATREFHTALRLKDGRVFIVGGYNGGYLSSAEIYDPATGLFSATTNGMTVARTNHTASLLQDGRVFITGGDSNGYLNSAEIFDPATGSFAATSTPMSAARAGHTATVFSSGKVLLAGGFNGSYLSSAEIFDPVAGTFTATGSMSVTRSGHTATLLSDGKVLIAGGQNENFLSSAEIFDPATGKFTAAAGAMIAQRLGHSATLLSSNKVLIAGGFNGSYLNSAEVYDPATGRFTATSGTMAAPRNGHAAAPLTGGKVLISGGNNPIYLNSTEIYDPTPGTFTAQPAVMGNPRKQHTATVLSDGKILLAGGENTKLLLFDVNVDQTDNVAPNIVFSKDSKVGFVGYTGSGVVAAFSPVSGLILKRIDTGGKPAFANLLPDGKSLVVVSILDNRIFMINTDTLALQSTFTYAKAEFGFGSIITLSSDGRVGYVSSTGTGEVIKFSLPDGKELGRLTGLQNPAQITLTLDEKTMMVVDVASEELVFADTSSLKQSYVFKAKDKLSTADFTIYNKAVLAPDGTTGIIASRDLNGDLELDTVWVFKTSTGEVLDTEKIGSQPGFTGVTPNGQNWVILNQFSISLIPTYDPKALQEIPTAQGDPLGSANIAFSSDSRYALYVSSSSDLVFQHDLGSLAVVGQTIIGDNPNISLEQPSAVALTPDGKYLAVLETISNNIDLLVDVTQLSMTKFIVSGNTFTGLSFVNLSNNDARVSLLAMDNFGQTISESGVVNPVEMVISPNAQFSMTIAEIFNFDISKDHLGWLSITSDQPQLASYLSVGQIVPTFLGFYLNRMDGVPLFTEQVYDWIVPELTRDSGETAKFDIVNPNFAQETYDFKRYAKDGTLISSKTGNVAFPTNRLEQSLSEFDPLVGQNKILITGGQSSGTTSSTTETFTTDSNASVATSSMTGPRQGHTSTLLRNGKVLISGGKNVSAILNTAETFDIISSLYTATTGTMTKERHRHSATPLQSGKVLIAGGQGTSSTNDTAETFDPDTGQFTATAGPMTTPRDAHTATLLPSGKVLIVGGMNGNVASNTAEIYDPSVDKFTATGSLKGARGFHTATLLSNGKVLIAGGFDGSRLNSAEIYDPVTGVFTSTSGSMTSRRDHHTATLLTDGTVLIAGGTDGTISLNSAEIYDPATGTFTLIGGTMNTPRDSHTATLLSDGRILVAGGLNGTTDLSLADIYDPTTKSFSATGSLSASRSGHAATYLYSSTDGYLRIKSPRGLLFTEFMEGGKTGSALNGIDVNKYTRVLKLYSPQFAITGSFKTILNLVNANSDSDATITLTLHAADGRVLGSRATVFLARNAQVKDDLANLFKNDSAIQGWTGWVEIESTADRVVGTVSFTDPDDTFFTTFALSAAPLYNFVFPMAAEDATFQTAVALLNSNDRNATVKIELWGPGGTLDRSTTMTLQPRSQSSLYLSDIFPRLEPRLIGNIRIQSDLPLYSFCLLNDRKFNFLAAVPAIPWP